MQVYRIDGLRVFLTGFLVVTLISCGGGASGIYVHDKNSREYLELRRDSTFFLREHGMGLSGQYRIDGATITLTLGDGRSVRGKIRGKNLIDDDGEVWVRQQRPLEGSAAQRQASTPKAPIKSQPNTAGTNLPVEDRLAGSTIGHPTGIHWIRALDDRGAVFSAANASRIEYPGIIPLEGTLEFWIKVNSGYHYVDSQFRANQDTAMIFSSDVQGGDVTWPGTAKLTVSRLGTLSYWMATSKGDTDTAATEARATKFRFGEWHAIGVSYGRQGQYIMLDGNIVASSPGRTQTFGQAGTHQKPLDIPTIGETLSHFWAYHQYEGGFEGVLAAFRVSSKQRDWVIATGIKDRNGNVLLAGF